VKNPTVSLTRSAALNPRRTLKLAGALGFTQAAVARIEQEGSELKLGAMKHHIEKIGGKLKFNVELSDSGGCVFHI
jgi:hypothetical protein